MNAYLEREYYPGHNARFARPASAEEDFHLPVPRGLSLDEVFRLETEHTIGNDWVVRADNRFYQVERQSRYAPARSKVLVCEYENGRIAIEYRGRKRAFHEIPAPRPAGPGVTPRVATAKRSSKPTAQHPWRLGYDAMPDRTPWAPPSASGCGNASGVPPRFGNLAPSARFPHFHKPLIVNLLWGHFYRGKEGDISNEA